MTKYNFKVITFNQDNNPEMNKLVKSCELYGYDLQVIGSGAGFLNFRQLKIDLFIQELEKLDCDFVMYTDSLDSWFLRDDIFTVYRRYYQDSIVISGNRNHYPDTKLYDGSIYPKGESTFRYICTSQIMAPRLSLIKALYIIRDSWNGFTDQEGWNYVFCYKLVDVKIDYRCRLFLNMTDVLLEEIDENMVLKETKVKPCSIHFGGAKGESPNGIAMREFYQKWLNKK